MIAMVLPRHVKVSASDSSSAIAATTRYARCVDLTNVLKRPHNGVRLNPDLAARVLLPHLVDPAGEHINAIDFVHRRCDGFDGFLARGDDRDLSDVVICSDVDRLDLTDVGTVLTRHHESLSKHSGNTSSLDTEDLIPFNR